MTRRKKSILSMAILAAIFIVHLSLPAKAAIVETVRIGYYEDGDYMYRNALGEYEGYNFEFLLELSKLSGMKYKVVDAQSWQNALKLLVDGDIDILPAVYRTKEREATMLFPRQPMGNVYTTLNVRMEDTQYQYEEFDKFDGMRVGIIKGGADGENFKEYCKQHKIDVKIEEYIETKDLLSALEDKTLDAVAITHLGKSSSFRTVAQFAPSPIYLAVSNKRPDILAKIDIANNDILLRNPGYQMDLYDKYLASSVDSRPVFTKEELEYIKSAPPIRVSYDPKLPPLTYQGEGGEFSGAVADIFAMIQEDSGLKFQFEANIPATALKKIEAGKLDVISTIDSDYLWDERHGMSTTLYYLRTPSMRITKDETAPVKILAQVKGYRLSEWVAKNSPDQEVMYFSSVEECFDAVRTGRAQATYMNTYVASYILSKPKFKGLSANTLSQYSNEICLGVSKNVDPRLFSILDKYIQGMPSKQMDELLLKHSTDGRSVTVWDFVLQHTWLVLLILSGIILLLCIYLRNIYYSRLRIRELLYKDDLTGLDNLERFYIRAEGLVADNKSSAYAIIYSDIDQFKLINDNFGFAQGDKLLCAYGKNLQSIIGKEECCARISADNFILLIEFKHCESVEFRLEKLRESLDRWRKENGIIPYEISISIGVYQVVEQEKNDIHKMIDLANYARLSAKNRLDNAIVWYDENMRKKALLEQELERRLPLALEQQEFEVYYQPKVDMFTDNIIGSEALVRWNHPEHGLLMPGAFIPLFEKKGVVVDIDLYVYDKVCAAIKDWQNKGVAMHPVSCNFSQLHFNKIGLAGQLASIADRWGTPHQLLEIEITESTIALDMENLDLILEELKKLEFLITIDDFGSGYSSLGQLQRLKADVLKLDRSFVSGGLMGNREQIVIKNLANMGKQLEMMVVCEGVETIAQANVLKSMGCHFAQGFYYHRPMPASEFEKLIHQQQQNDKKG